MDHPSMKTSESLTVRQPTGITPGGPHPSGPPGGRGVPIVKDSRETPRRFSKISVIIYVFLHLGCLGVFYTGTDLKNVSIFCGAFIIRVVAVSVVYHRYFAHRAFRTSRTGQFLLGLYGTIAVL